VDVKEVLPLPSILSIICGNELYNSNNLAEILGLEIQNSLEKCFDAMLHIVSSSLLSILISNK
jgi:hypothetical protein